MISAEYLVDQHQEPPRFFAMFHAKAAAEFTTAVGETGADARDSASPPRCSDSERGETGADAALDARDSASAPRCSESAAYDGAPLVFLDCSDEAARQLADRSSNGLGGLDGLFQCSGSCAMDLRAQQVALRASSLIPWNSFVLQMGASQFIWHGKGASLAKREYAQAIGRALAAGRACITIDEATVAPERWPQEFWRVLPDGPHGLPRLRLVTPRPTAPRLFSIRTLGGRWQIDELFCFGRRSLRPESVLMLDACNQAFLWFGPAARLPDREVAPKWARLYLQIAAADGRPVDCAPTILEGGRETPDFACHFHDWGASGALAFWDPYEARLAELGRSQMFGRVVRHVSRHPATQGGPELTERERERRGDGRASYKEGACSMVGVASDWLADVTAGVPAPDSDHVQEPLPMRGLTLVVTSLLLGDVKKRARCRRLAAMLTEAQVEFHTIDLALPQFRQARYELARLLKRRHKSELDILSLPLLLKDDDVLLVSDERPETPTSRGGWPKVDSLETEHALREWLGLGMGPFASSTVKTSRTLTERLARATLGKVELPTLEELRIASRGGNERAQTGAVSDAPLPNGGDVGHGHGGVLHEGYLEKEGGLMKNRWERRFFLLAADGTLYWFGEALATEAALGALQLRSEGATLKTLGVKLSFEILTAKKSYVLRTQDGRDLADWLRAIRQVLHGRDSGPHATPTKNSAAAAAAPSSEGAEGGSRSRGFARRSLGPSHPSLSKLLTNVGADVAAVLDLSKASGARRLSFAPPPPPPPPDVCASTQPVARLSIGVDGEDVIVPSGATRARLSTVLAAALPSSSVPFGLLAKMTAKRGTKVARFFLVRDSVLLYYEVNAASRALWENLIEEHGAGPGGWCARGPSSGDGAYPRMENASTVAVDGTGVACAIKGDWVIKSQDDVWRPGEKLCEMLDPKHPSGTIPLAGTGIEPLREDEGFGLRVLWYNSPELEAVKMLCSSAAERDAWIRALVTARLATSQNVYTTALAAEEAQELRDGARRERDTWRYLAEELREEVRANETAAQRAHAQLEAQAVRQKRDLEMLASRDEEIERMRRQAAEAAEVRDRLLDKLQRAEECASRLIDDREALLAAKLEIEASADEARAKVQAERSRVSDLEAQLAAAHAALEVECAKMRAAEACGASLSAQLARADETSALEATKAVAVAEAAELSSRRDAERARAEDAQLKAAREALEAEQHALAERKNARAAKDEQQQRRRRRAASTGAENAPPFAPLSAGVVPPPPPPPLTFPKRPGTSLLERFSAAAPAAREADESKPTSPYPPARVSLLTSLSLVADGIRNSFPISFPPLARAAEGVVASDAALLLPCGGGGDTPRARAPQVAPPTGSRAGTFVDRFGQPVEFQIRPPAAPSDHAEALRDQVEAEQSALRDRKLEREARQLRRRLELAEAQQEPPPPPTGLPPPLASRRPAGDDR